MGLYGMTSGQALGRGTFTFDRIVPNRYLLDSRVNNDSVMPGRYALIEYDRPVAVVSDINNFTYEKGSKAYDIIPVKDGVIDIAEGTDCIFVCVMDSNNNNLYQYYYYNFNDSDNDRRITSYGSPMTPNEFNKIVDAAYIAKNTAEDIDSKASDLWDSTAWIKIIDKEKSEFKYIKIADLNVLTPSFTVGTNKSPLDDSNNFVAPTVTPTEGEPGSFTIQFPAPLDIDLIVNDGSQPEEGEEEFQRVTAEYIKNKTKQFTIKIPEIQNATAATTAANNATTAATAAANKANAAAKAADDAREGLNGSIVNSIGTENLTVSIGGETSLSSGKLNIETTINSDRIITAAIINSLWNPQETQEGN